MYQTTWEILFLPKSHSSPAPHIETLVHAMPAQCLDRPWEVGGGLKKEPLEGVGKENVVLKFTGLVFSHYVNLPTL